MRTQAGLGLIAASVLAGVAEADTAPIGPGDSTWAIRSVLGFSKTGGNTNNGAGNLVFHAAHVMGDWLQSELTEAFLWGIVLQQNQSSERRTPSGATIVRRVENWVDGQAQETIHIGDLCRELHLSRRTLHRAFTETLGIGPARYLSHKRLIAVRAELLRADPSEVRVTDAATMYGFWQLGRFAKDYRQMFGECPSETLKRPSRERRGNAIPPRAV